MNSSLEAVTVEGQVVSLLLRVFALGVSGYVTALIAVYLLGTPQPAKRPADEAELRALRREVAELRALLTDHLPPTADGAATADGPASLAGQR